MKRLIVLPYFQETTSLTQKKIYLEVFFIVSQKELLKNVYGGRAAASESNYLKLQNLYQNSAEGVQVQPFDALLNFLPAGLCRRIDYHRRQVVDIHRFQAAASQWREVGRLQQGQRCVHSVASPDSVVTRRDGGACKPKAISAD